MNSQPQPSHHLQSHGHTNNSQNQSLNTNHNPFKTIINPFAHKSATSQAWFRPQSQTKKHQDQEWLSHKKGSQHFCFSSTENQLADENLKQLNKSNSLFLSRDTKEKNGNHIHSPFDQFNSEKPFSNSHNLFAHPNKFCTNPTEKNNGGNSFNENSQNSFCRPILSNMFYNQPKVSKENKASNLSIFNNSQCYQNLFNNNKRSSEQEQKEENHSFLFSQKIRQLEREERVAKIQKKFEEQQQENKLLKNLIFQMKEQMVKKENQMTQRIKNLEQFINALIENENNASQTQSLTKYESEGTSSEFISVCSSCESVESEDIRRKNKSQKKKKQKKQKKQISKDKQNYCDDFKQTFVSKDDKKTSAPICDQAAVKQLEVRLNKKLDQNSEKMVCYLQEKFEESNEKMQKVIEILKMNCMKKTNKIIKNPFCYE